MQYQSCAVILRACDYYGDLENTKIVVQCIAYYSQFGLDEEGYYVNNKVIVIPTGDLYVLAVLNSRVTWWIVNRTFQHMKDEGLSVDVQFLVNLPVPEPTGELRAAIESTTRQLISVAGHSTGEVGLVREMELRLNNLVQDAFQLTDEERDVLANTLPPRDPVATVECDER
jgi:hypothetical protein